MLWGGLTAVYYLVGYANRRLQLTSGLTNSPKVSS